MQTSAMEETGDRRGIGLVGMKRGGDTLRPEWTTPCAARLMERLRTCVPVTEADLTNASKSLRPIASRILSAPLADRVAIADDWLASCDEADSDAIELAVIDTEPAQPTQALAVEIESGQDRQVAIERREAEQWLRELLGAGPVPAKQIIDAARNHGLSQATLQQAKEGLGIVSSREGFGKDARWIWSLLGARTGTN